MIVDKLKIALIQMRAANDKTENIRRATTFVRAAATKGARMVLLPEVFCFRGKLSLRLLRQEVAETVNGPTVKRFQEIARENDIFLVLGSIYEKVPGKKKLYNTAVVIGPGGKKIGHYRKRRLFDARLATGRVCESGIFLPGKKPAVFPIGKFHMGSAICYDVRFPELFRVYREQGCEMVMIPSNFTYETGRAHWETLLRARAVENRCYVLAPAQCGSDAQGRRSYGNSMVVDPWGKVVARAGTKKEEVLIATVRRKDIIKARMKLPLF